MAHPLFTAAKAEIKKGHSNAVEFIAGKLTVEQVRALRVELNDARYNKGAPEIDLERAYAEAVYGEGC